MTLQQRTPFTTKDTLVQHTTVIHFQQPAQHIKVTQPACLESDSPMISMKAKTDHGIWTQVKYPTPPYSLRTPPLTIYTDRYSSRRSICEPSTKPSIVPWPSPYQDTKSLDRQPSHHRKSSLKSEHITIINAEPGMRAKKYDDRSYFRDEFASIPRRSSSRESYGSRSSSRDSYSGDDYMARRPISLTVSLNVDFCYRGY